MDIVSILMAISITLGSICWFLLFSAPGPKDRGGGE